MDQSRAPLLEALSDYRACNRYGFTPPGHRQGLGVDERVSAVLGDSFQHDVLASGGLDDRRTSNHHLRDAEDLMADAGGDGGLLVGRDSHKSIVAGLIFSGVQPHWITPRWDADRHFSHPPSPEQVAKAWSDHPDAAGALIVSPSPYGTCADLAAITEVCHERGKPLIVDEAWGAHLPFHESLPTWAMDAGADVCVVSVHKMGAGFEQGSVFHLQGDLVDQKRLSACADLLMTTSPNVLVYSAIDGWRRQMVERGHELLSAAVDTANELREDIDGIPGLKVLESELLGVEASHDLDRLQVLVDVSGTGSSGYQVSDWLRQHRHIDLGLCDHRRILATLSFADDTRSTHRLLEALNDWRSQVDATGPAPHVDLPRPGELELESVQLPRDAFFATTETVPISKSAGRISAEQITPYPPGIPAVVPGERINDAVIDYLRSGLSAGMQLPDPADPSLETVRVVA